MHEHAWSFSCLRNAHGGQYLIRLWIRYLNSIFQFEQSSIDRICFDACLPCSAHQTKLRPSGQSASRCRLRRADGGQSDRCLGFSYVYFYLYILYITFDSSSYTCRAHIPNRERWFLCSFLVWSNLCSFLLLHNVILLVYVVIGKHIYNLLLLSCIVGQNCSIGFLRKAIR